MEKTTAELKAEAFALAGELYQLVRKIDRSPHYQPARLIGGFLRSYGNAGRLEVERLDRLVKGEIQAQQSPKPPRLPREGGKRPALPLLQKPLPNQSQRPGAVAAAGRVKPITVSPDVVTTVTMQPAKQPTKPAESAGLAKEIKTAATLVGLANDLHNEQAPKHLLEKRKHGDGFTPRGEATELLKASETTTNEQLAAMQDAFTVDPLNETELATLKGMKPRAAGMEFGRDRLYATSEHFGLSRVEGATQTQLAAALIEHLKTV